MKFLILGAAGMAGHTIAIYLKEQGHDVVAFTQKYFEHCSQNILGDALDYNNLKIIIDKGSYDVVINCIGILNKYAEENKARSVMLNSFLPHFLSSAVKDSNARLVHLSTDCVFSGKTGDYVETSFPDGASFYDRTKALGEVTDEKNITFRDSIVGPDLKEAGIGLFNWFMKQNESIDGYANVYWTGITTLTLAKAIEAASQQKTTGLYHLVNNSKISKFQLISLFNSHFKNNELIIKPDESFKLDKSLINTRNDFDFIVPSYDDMISEMKDWIYIHKEIYPHYFNL